jgi:hypothetical protein
VAKASVVLARQQAVQRGLGGARAKAPPRGIAGGHPLFPAEVANRIFATYEAGDLITACAWCAARGRRSYRALASASS